MNNAGILAGATWRADITVSDPDDGSFDLAACTYVVRVTSRAGVTLYELTEGDGLTRVGQQIAAELSAARTATLAVGTYYYRLIVTAPEGYVDPPSDGAGAIVVTGVLPGPVEA